MRGFLGRRAGRILGGLALVVLLAQGCILEKKTIIDIYEAVLGVPQGSTILVSDIAFGLPYCIQAGSVKLDVKLNPRDPLMTVLLVSAAVIPLVGTPTVWSFVLDLKQGKFKGEGSVASEICLDPGDKLRWWATPQNGDILFGAEMKSKLKFKKFKNNPA